MKQRLIQWLSRWVAQRLFQAAVLLLAGLFALCGLGFLGAAAYIALNRVLAPMWAALVMAGGLFLIALMLWVIVRLRSMSRRRRRRASKPRPDDDLEAAIGAVSTFGRDTRDWLRGHGDKVSLAALVAGMAFGASPRLRRLVLGTARAAERAAVAAARPRRR